MMPLVVGHRWSAGQMRCATGVAYKKAKGMASAATIQVKLFSAIPVAFGHDSSIGCLRATIDPRLDGKSDITGCGEIQSGNIGHTTIVGCQRAKTRHGMWVDQFISGLNEMNGRSVGAVIAHHIIMSHPSARFIQS